MKAKIQAVQEGYIISFDNDGSFVVSDIEIQLWDSINLNVESHFSLEKFCKMNRNFNKISAAFKEILGL